MGLQMHNIKRDKLIKAVLAVCIAVFTFCVVYFNAFSYLDNMLCDAVYQRSDVPSKEISIIAIDEKTMAEYGDVSTWDRSIYAELVEKLTADSAYAPKLIVFDMLFVSDKDEAGDARFAKACDEAGVPVITAANFVQRAELFRDETGRFVLDEANIQMVEFPYASLKNASEYGFANTTLDTDGFVRNAMRSVSYGGETIDSLAYVIYRKYCELSGIKQDEPKLYGNGKFYFKYSADGDGYQTISMADVLNNPENYAKLMAGDVVMVGAYAPGMQDSYGVAVDHGNKMYGVKIHANIFQALVDGKVYTPFSRLAYACIVTLLALLFYLLLDKRSVKISSALFVAAVIMDVILAIVVFKAGHRVLPIVYPIIILGIIFVYLVVSGYLMEVLKKKRVLSAFKKYVAPQVVEELSKSGEFHIELGGEARDIAVLFVDIRGFTPMSEALTPAEVVEVLNDYLNLTTESIFKNRGTLDKFIGDATMAIFNAPVDLDDYVYRAVCTARDIAAGSEGLAERMQERFGRTVSFGIGVNCGPAVVGNIGNNSRMDYTAIGDTVNTAARLESNAKPGQILISEEVYNRVSDRVEAHSIGEIPLKGKSKGVNVFVVDKVM